MSRPSGSVPQLLARRGYLLGGQWIRISAITHAALNNASALNLAGQLDRVFRSSGAQYPVFLEQVHKSAIRPPGSLPLGVIYASRPVYGKSDHNLARVARSRAG